jgi:aldose 1-epimerase
MALGVSGEEVVLRHGPHTAAVTQVGATVREFHTGDRTVLDGFGVDEICPAGHGQPLLPWPNRIGDGRYGFAGAEHQLALNEPERGNAIHGLTRWQAWEIVERSEDAVRLATRVYPQPGYPFALELEVGYRLDDAGLTVTYGAVNAGTTDLPFGAGQHPYRSPGPGGIDGARLRLAVGTVVEVDDRLLPTGVGAVPAAFDFRADRELRGVHLDTCFGGLERDGDGRFTADLTGGDGRTVRLWMDRSWRWCQLFSSDPLGGARHRAALAVEPMTCPPDAFRSGQDVIVLAPGQRFDGAWGVGLLG